MNRKQRIEVVRYRRRITITGTSAGADPLADQIAGDAILDVLTVVPPAPELVICDGAAADKTAAARTPWRRLRDLLSLCR
ncbi:MAG: hypothetical protein M3R69_12985 [Acidobacteriota bacterium]|nr:hypothetical protein [Acidobacteriota bacterium]